MTIERSWMVGVALAIGACGGGVIQVEATLPPPSVDGSSGVLVTVPDGSSVCESTQILVYSQAPIGDPRAMPAGVAPIVKAGGFGTYSAESRRCTMVANVPPGDYWVIIDLPKSHYTNGGYPSLPGSGTHPTIFRAGAYPVHVEKDKGTKLDLTLTAYL